MKYICVDPVEFLYPDVTDYKSGTDKINILTPRGSYACAQILLFEGEGSVEVMCEGWEPEVYEMVAIPVEEYLKYDWSTEAPHTPERKGPFEVYDCLKPYSGSVAFKDGVAAVYFSMWIPKDAQVGSINGIIKVGEVSIPVRIEVSSAVVPEETLDVTMLYIDGHVSRYHDVQYGGEDFKQLEYAYLSMLRRMRQTVFWLIKDCKVTALEDNRYEFDFSPMEAYINKVMSLGYKKIYHRLGYRASWGKPTILVNNLPCMSYEGYCFLAQYLPALHQFLEEHGWTDKYLLSICDEPDEVMGMEYRALCNIVRRFAPGIKLIDPTHFGAVEGSIDICVPMSSDYDKHMDEYESYRKYGDILWYYDCMGPRGEGYINRFLDFALIATRYHGWGNYAHDLKGYLHWAANHYQPNQDPFTQSIPLHSNAGGDPGKIPPGDTHIMYPGDDGPWMSVRLENYRAGFEEYEMLRAVAKEDKELADSICKKVFRRFNDVEYDPLVFRAARNELIRAMENKKWYKDALLVNRDPNWYWFALKNAVDQNISYAQALEEYFTLFKGFKTTDVQLCVYENTSIIPSESVMWRGLKYLQKNENGIPVDYSNESRIANLYQAMHDEGVDAPQIFIDTMKKIGIRPWITLRMNDAHYNGDKTAFLRDDFYYTAEKNGWMIGDEYGYYAHCLDYSVPEVRERMYGLIGEILDKYDMFGLELDFMREIYCFDYRHNPDCCEIMMNFMRHVKELVTKAEKRVGHPIRLMIRTHRSPKDALEFGFDIKKMCEEGLVDAVVPSPRWETADSAIPVSEWRELLGDDVAIFPAIETLNYKFTATTPEISKAYAAAFYPQGADGLYLYNHEYYTERNRGTWMIDRESCLKGRRDFVVTFQDIASGSYERYKPLPMSADGQLPLRIGHISKDSKVSVVIDFEGEVPPTVSAGCVKNASGEKIDAIIIRDHDNERCVNITEHGAYVYDISGIECELDLVLEFAGCGVVHYVNVVVEN